ncbi:MAG: carbamoyltransferase C-terminal domain-containing protein, partial [Deltaproteobacteria bacterium]
GSLLLNMDYFDFATGLTMCCNDKWESLFGVPRRPRESLLDQRHMDLALAIQQATEDIVLAMAATAKKLTGADNLVMAGGVALNCVANGKLIRRGIFQDLWIQPAAGDAGGALGAALAARHIWQGAERQLPNPQRDSMQGAYLGPEYGADDILRVARRRRAPFRRYDDFDELTREVARLLTQGQVVGWFQGRMEWGPRALGNRSILGDSRHPEMQKRLNLKIKYRVQENHRHPLPEGYETQELFERLYHLRSDVPAITHVDYSARIQTVHRDTNQKYWRLIAAFKELTGCGLIVNTSFNVRGEPIVCTPEDAYQCFMRTEMDYLVMGDFLFSKTDQPAWQETGDWRTEFELD